MSTSKYTLFSCISLFLSLLFMVSLGSSFVLGGAMDNTVFDVSLAYQDPDPVEPGEFVELKFNVKNTGGNVAKGVEFQLLSEYPFSLYDVEDSIKSVGDVQVYDASKTDTGEVSFKYRFAVDVNALDGVYDLQLEYRAQGGSSIGIWQKLDPIQVKLQTSKTQLYIADAITVPERVGPGETAEIHLTLKNLGASMLQDIKAVLEFQNTTSFAPYQASNEQIVKSLAPDAEISIVFKIIAYADTLLRPHKVPLKVTYKDPSGKSYEKTIYIPIIVDRVPEYVLNLENPGVYQKGDRGKVVVSISNIGPGDLNYVTLQLAESPSYELISPSTVYVGNLESDDYETAQFDLYVKEYTREFPLSFGISYKDTFNRPYLDEVVIPLKLFTGREAALYGVSQKKSNLYVVMIIVLILFGGAVYYFKYVREKKKLSV